MCALQQAGKIANDDLKQHLLPYGCLLVKHTPGLWQHITSNLTFTLIVFGIKHTKINYVKHLLHTMQQKCNIIVDWTGSQHAGVSLD